jgi:hypothetical protein
MAGIDPDQKDRHNRIDQRQQQAAVIGLGRPARPRRFQPESPRDRRRIVSPPVAEEPVHLVQGPAEHGVIGPRRPAADLQALAQFLVGFAPPIVLRGVRAAKHHEIIAAEQRRQHAQADQIGLRDQRRLLRQRADIENLDQNKSAERAKNSHRRRREQFVVLPGHESRAQPVRREHSIIRVIPPHVRVETI